MSSMKTTRTPEDWAKVDPLYLMQRVARGETSGTAAYNLMRDALADIASLAQRCRELEEAVERMDGCNRAIAADALAACSERDTLRAEVEALQAKLRRIESMAECGSVQSWLSLPDEDKAKWFGLHVEQDCERLKFRSDALALRELVAECAEHLNFSELTSIAHGSILHRKMIDAMEAPR